MISHGRSVRRGAEHETLTNGRVYAPVTRLLHEGVGCGGIPRVQQPIAFSELFATWAHRSRDEFIAAHPAPCLVMPSMETPSAVEQAETERVDPARTVAHWDLQLLVPVVARDSSERRITVGRAADNDVVLPDARVSKTQ